MPPEEQETFDPMVKPADSPNPSGKVALEERFQKGIRRD